MAQKTCSYKQQFQTFYDDIVMDVVHTYFELKILGNKSLQCFLDENAHILFHKYEPTKICCECSNRLLIHQSRRPELEKKQFELLYMCLETSLLVPDHVHADTQMVCLHKYIPNTTTVSEGVITLDICLICILVKNCCIPGTFPGDPVVLENIKKCRNFNSHLGTQESQQELEAIWTLLESSVRDLGSTLGKAYTHGLQKRIALLNAENNYVKEISSNVSDNVLEKIFQTFGDLNIQIENAQFRLASTEFKSNKTRQEAKIRTAKDSSRCFVIWKFADPGHWDVERMTEKLKCLSNILDFDIEFVYAGSIVLITSTTFSIFANEGTFKAVTEDFLKIFVKTTELDTSEKAEVDIFVEICLSFPDEHMPPKELDESLILPVYHDERREAIQFNHDDLVQTIKTNGAHEQTKSQLYQRTNSTVTSIIENVNITTSELNVIVSPVPLEVQAQSPVYPQMSYTTRLRQKYNVYMPVHDCALVGTMIILVSNAQANLVLIDTVIGSNRTIPLSGKGYFVSVINNRTVAVTLLNECVIQIVDLETGDVVNKIKINPMTYHVCYYEGELFVSLGKEIQVIDLNGSVLRNVQLPLHIFITGFTVDRHRLYYKEYEDTLLCCDLYGEEIWRFRQELFSGMTKPTTDIHGNVFLMGTSSCNVVMVTSDGQYKKELISDPESTQMEKIKAMSCDRKCDVFVLVDEIGSVFLFDVLKPV